MSILYPPEMDGLVASANWAAAEHERRESRPQPANDIYYLDRACREIAEAEHPATGDIAEVELQRLRSDSRSNHLAQLLEAARGGRVQVFEWRNGKRGHRARAADRITIDCVVAVSEVNRWLEEEGFDVRIDAATSARAVAAGATDDDEVACEGSADNKAECVEEVDAAVSVAANADSPAMAELPARTSAPEHHMRRVEKALKDAGIDPLAIPPCRNGLRSVAKEAAWLALGSRGVDRPMSESTFSKTWQRLRNEKRIVDAAPPSH